ncbi:MAG: hypothetical protein RML72_05375 [Bacteroidia bacterium]|nr:hypothetical protein [Bacteroidia bacterium]MDW8158293.1 hypothetical protein [Bacteroidia bacterium]
MIVLWALSIGGCYKDEIIIKQKVKVLIPEYMDYATLRSAFKVEAPQPLQKVGKIYTYGKYLFINEKEKGIHVVDKSNGTNPITIAFLNLPGNVDMAIKDNYLYADSYVDLVVIDLQQIQNAKEVGRLKNIFPYPKYTFPYLAPDPQKGVPIAWKEKEMEIEGRKRINKGDIIPDFVQTESTTPTNSSSKQMGSSGQGGSLARFTIWNNYLYTVDNQNLQAFDLTTPVAPLHQKSIHVGFEIETIFPAKNHLFIGSQEAMYIYSLESPASPYFVSKYTHIRSCDPVVVWGNYAYVTLRTGNTCQGFFNQLEVINIQNLRAPALEKIYPMQQPFGLGADENLLFVCDNGLKVYNTQNPQNLILLKHHTGFQGYDAIAREGELIVSAQEGIYLYRYNSSGDLTLLSRISSIP